MDRSAEGEEVQSVQEWQMMHWDHGGVDLVRAGCSADSVF